MMPSPHALERALGMNYYATSTPGIGGLLRSQPEDFVVEELSVPPGGEGPYLLCRLTKRNWEHQRAMKEVARALHVSPRRISWAGTKDRRAVTTQLIAIYGVSEEDIERVALEGISLEVVGRSRSGLSLGMLMGNRFRIRIRECFAEDLETRVKEVAEAGLEGFPNYYGIQRFGAIRPVTHLVGERILQHDPKGAVMTYIGVSFEQEAGEVKDARRAFLETEDAAEALRTFPRTLSFERAMLQSLHDHPEDYRRALSILPPKLLSMFVSAFQSYLFNIALSARWEDGLPLGEPRMGDLLLFSSGRMERVTRVNLKDALIHCGRGRAEPALCIPGASDDPDWPVPPVVQQILEEKGIDATGFRDASEFVKTSYRGFCRPVKLATAIHQEVHAEAREVLLEFALKPGQYATTVCREFTKSDPLQMV